MAVAVDDGRNYNTIGRTRNEFALINDFMTDGFK